MLKKILLVCFCLILSGCPSPRQEETTPKITAPIGQTATNVPVPEAQKSPDQLNVADLQKKLDESNKKIIEATTKGDIIAKLSAEKETLMVQVQLSESYIKIYQANVKAYESQIKDKNTEIKDAKIAAWQVKLWWMAGICGLLALVGGGIAIAFPLLRSVAWKACAVLGTISGIMLVVAQCLPTVAWLLGFVPYLLVLSGIVAVIYGVFALIHWYRDNNGLAQTAEGLEVLKGSIPGFSDHMLKYVDGSMVDHIKKLRKKIDVKNKLTEFKKATK